MVEFDNEFDGPSNSNKPNDEPLLPDELQDAFRAIAQIPVEYRSVFLLHSAGLNPCVVSLIENIDLRTTERRLRKSRQILRNCAERLVDLKLGIAKPANEPGSAPSEPSDLAGRMIELVPAESLEVYRRYKKNESLQLIAADKDIPVEEAERRMAVARDTFQKRLILAILRLMELHADQPVPSDSIGKLALYVSNVRQEVGDTDPDTEQPPWILSKEERLECENAFYDLDAVYHEVFEADAAWLNREQIADLLEIKPDDVRKRLRRARRNIAEHLERLVIGYLQRKKGHPNAPRMSRKKATAARAFYASIPEDCRQPFGLFMATGSSVNEISTTLLIPAGEVERRIALAKKHIRSRALTAAILAARRGEDIQTARKTIVSRLQYLVSLRRGYHVERSLNRIRSLKPLDTLTEGENREISLLFRELDRTQQEVYALHRGLEFDQKQVAELLDISEEEVRDRLREVWEAFAQRLEQLISTMLRSDAFVPETPDLTDSARETAQVAFEFITEDAQAFLGQVLISGESIPDIARRMELSREEFESRAASARRMLVLRGEIVTISWLREKTDGISRAEDILRNVERRSEDHLDEDDEPQTASEYDSYINAELIEAQKALAQMDYDCREAFVFGVGAGLGAEKVAEYQKVSLAEAKQRLADAQETIRLRIEQLIRGMLRIRLGQTNAPRMKETEFYTAKATFQFIPKECRDVYIRYCVHGEMLQEIAEKLQIPFNVAEERFATATRVVLSRAFFLAIGATKGFTGGKPNGEVLLGDPKKIRFPVEAWYQPPTRDSEAVAETTKIVDTSQTKTEPEKKKRWKPIAAALTFIGALPTQLGAAKSTTEAITVAGLVASIPAFATLCMTPVLWILSLFFTNAIYGRSLIQTAPTVYARQWLVKQLFLLYSSSFVLFFAIPIIIWSTPALFGREKDSLILFTLYVVCNIVLFIWTTCRCSQWRSPSKTLSNREGNAKKLNRILNWGFIFDTAVLVLFFYLLVQDIFVPKWGNPNARGFFIMFGVATSIVVGFHAIVYLTFRHFYRMSKDEAAFQEFEPTWLMKQSFWNSRGFAEFVRLVPFASWMIFTNIYHILFVRLHVRGSLFEIAGYSTCWVTFWFVNTQCVKSDWTRWFFIVVVFVIQIIIHRWLRFNFY